MIVEISFFVIGAILLFISAKISSKALEGFVRYTRISEILVGFIVISLLTSLPELFTTVEAAIEGVQNICLGTLIGSVAINFYILLSVQSLIKEVAIRESKLTFLYHSFLLLLIFITSLDLVIDKIDALLIFASYFLISFNVFSRGRTKGKISLYKTIIYGSLLAFSSFILVPASYLIVYYGEEISRILKISDFIIAIVIIAFITNFPEFFTTIVSGKKLGEASVGDILGSNLIDLGIVLPTYALFKPINLTINFLFLLSFLLASFVITSIIVILLKKLPKLLTPFLLIQYTFFVFLSIYLGI